VEAWGGGGRAVLDGKICLCVTAGVLGYFMHTRV
jgi:hypothetical protein